MSDKSQQPLSSPSAIEHENGQSLAAHRDLIQEEGALIIEGLLNISWGLRRPIRLQIQDDRERVHLSSASWTPGRSSFHPKEPPLQDGKVTAQEPSTQAEHTEESSKDGSEPLEEDEETPQLMRTKSDAACVIQRRPRCRAPGEAQRIRRHRFSINGHFYNHKVTPQLGLSPGGPEATATGNQHLTQTSVFTPAYGSMTNVRVNSTMTTLQVLTLLLNKFRVENGPSEFALYIVHESGGKYLPLLPDHKHRGLCPFSKLTDCAPGTGGQEWGAQLGCAACTGPVPFPALGHSVHITSAPPRFKSKHIHHPFLNPTRIISNGKLPSPVGLVGRSEHPGLQGGSEAPSPVRTAAAEPVPCVPLCSAGMAQI
ncbi:ras association domain-containing protein 4 isoform X3 [Sus scrofa]|uniref:ras association domain-containing protein 4 isoform X3 n=1 Tax=Sus scrofa TaxID=9823 RepID=UPI0006B1B0C5|nr:ras association domain-containing protein 4 isoform X3 [Sus scrofa]